LALLPWEWEAVLMSRRLAGCLRSPLGQALLRSGVEVLPEEPAAERRHVRCAVVAEAENRSGRRAISRLYTSDAHTFTTEAALAVVQRVLAGDWQAGFQTPARIYGADFVLSLDGVIREDLAG
ncbi:MAG: saccharopine dehydrogenase, partial [Acidobacteriota bacterium]